MAKKIGIELDFNTKQAQVSAKEMAQAMDSLSKETKELNEETKKAEKSEQSFEQRLNQLNKTVKEAPINVRKMNQQIQEYQAIALEAGRNTPVGKKALQEAAQLRDRYVDIQNETKRLANDGYKLQAALDLGTSVLGGFTAFQGITAMMGVENEELQQTLVKLQGAQAALVGIETIRKNLEKESTLVLVAKEAKEKAMLALTKAKTLWTNKAAVAQRVLNVAMSANPIGLIVTAIGLLVAGFIAFSDKIKSVVMPILQPLIDAFDFVSDAVEEVAASLGLIPSAADRAAKAQADAADKARQAVVAEERKKTDAVIQAEQEKRQARSDAYDFEIAKLQAAGQATFDVEQEKLGYVLDSLARQKEALQDQIAFEKEQLEKSAGQSVEIWTRNGKQEFNAYQLLSEIRIDQKQKELDEVEEASKEAAQTRELNQIKEDKRRNDAAKRAAEEARKAKEAADKKAEEDKKEKEAKEKQKEKDRLAREKERKQRELEQQQAFENELEQLDEERYQKSLSNEEREITQVQDKYFRLIEIAKQYGLDTAELEKAQKEELAAINKKYRDEEDAANTDQKLKDIQLEKDTSDAKLSVAESTVAGLSSLTQIAIKDSQKAEKIQKAFALAQIAIDTAKAISALVAASQANPLNAVTVGGAGAAQFASGIATILANMAQAAALLKRPSPNVSNLSSSAGGGVAGAGVPINAVQNGSTLIGNGQPEREVNKVVVVESDITSTQQGISQIQSQATVVE